MCKKLNDDDELKRGKEAASKLAAHLIAMNAKSLEVTAAGDGVLIKVTAVVVSRLKL
jgi:hypothetical protein